MNISANLLGKRFDREWIFKDFSFNLVAGNTYAITGPNGSGKSTLLRILWGQMLPSAGTVKFESDGINITQGDVYRHISIAAPYMDLIDEFSLEEMVAFHFHYKAARENITTLQALDMMELTHARQKLIRDFSSGMRQRLKLALAFFSNSSALFLDEPTTNLDRQAIEWYWQNLKLLPANVLILIASNQADDYPTTSQKINILHYKRGYKTAIA